MRLERERIGGVTGEAGENAVLPQRKRPLGPRGQQILERLGHQKTATLPFPVIARETYPLLSRNPGLMTRIQKKMTDMIAASNGGTEKIASNFNLRENDSPELQREVERYIHECKDALPVEENITIPVKKNPENKDNASTYAISPKDFRGIRDRIGKVLPGKKKDGITLRRDDGEKLIHIRGLEAFLAEDRRMGTAERHQILRMSIRRFVERVYKINVA